MEKNDLILPDRPTLERLIAHALEEDVGQGDITSKLTLPAGKKAELRFVARQKLVVCGGFIPALVYAQLGQNCEAKAFCRDGEQVEPGQVIATARGDVHTLLVGERVALNLMQRASGVATLTRRFVEAMAGSKAVLLDTRKTMPGMRLLDKYAVRAGGGQNHRMRLDDMILIKDNHIAACGSVTAAIQKAQQAKTGLPIVVECDTLAQVKEAVALRPTRILLDNMAPETLRAAVAMADGIALEASGNVSLENIGEIARTGVDFISVGKITHSATAVDIGADYFD